MSDDNIISLKNVCWTCLSVDRKLYQLKSCEDFVDLKEILNFVPSSQNNSIQFYDKLHICWECKAITMKFKTFRFRAIMALKKLSEFTKGNTDIKLRCFSNLTKSKMDENHDDHNYFNKERVFEIKCEIDSDDIDPLADSDFDSTAFVSTPKRSRSKRPVEAVPRNINKPINQIRVNSKQVVKKVVIQIDRKMDDPKMNSFQEMIDSDDIDPLADNQDSDSTLSVPSPIQSRSNSPENQEVLNRRQTLNREGHRKKAIDPKAAKSKLALKKVVVEVERKKYYEKMFKIKKLSAEEVTQEMNKKREGLGPINCMSCGIDFKNDSGLTKHNSDFHIKKEDYSKCTYCEIYVHDKLMSEHLELHTKVYVCASCSYSTHEYKEMATHQKLHPQRDRKKYDQLIYNCRRCPAYFNTRKEKDIHRKLFHKEVFTCELCNKSFSKKNHLKLHYRVHIKPRPREECSVCHKLIRSDLMANHAIIHTEREQYHCLECNKSYFSKYNYEQHLKYAKAHTDNSNVKFYECDNNNCDKRFRTKQELRNHHSYVHKGLAFKCPSCDKVFPNKAKMNTHVKRVHDGIKKVVICHTCGKPFKYNCIKEHERTHTGERPLSCNMCGMTFRQKAALYMHKRGVHRVPMKNTKPVPVTTTAIDED